MKINDIFREETLIGRTIAAREETLIDTAHHLSMGGGTPAGSRIEAEDGGTMSGTEMRKEREMTEDTAIEMTIEVDGTKIKGTTEGVIDVTQRRIGIERIMIEIEGETWNEERWKKSVVTNAVGMNVAVTMMRETSEEAPDDDEMTMRKASRRRNEKKNEKKKRRIVTRRSGREVRRMISIVDARARRTREKILRMTTSRRGKKKEAEKTTEMKSSEIDVKEKKTMMTNGKKA